MGLGMKSRVGMTGGSTRYRPLYEDRPNHNDRFEHHEHDYYGALAIPVKIGQWPGPAGFRVWSIAMASAAADLKTKSTGSQVLVTQKAGNTYTQGDSRRR